MILLALRCIGLAVWCVDDFDALFVCRPKGATRWQAYGDKLNVFAPVAPLAAWMCVEVVDVHKAWCGPCAVMEPTWKRIFLDNDDADNRIDFVSVGLTALTFDI